MYIETRAQSLTSIVLYSLPSDSDPRQRRIARYSSDLLSLCFPAGT